MEQLFTNRESLNCTTFRNTLLVFLEEFFVYEDALFYKIAFEYRMGIAKAKNGDSNSKLLAAGKNNYSRF